MSNLSIKGESFHIKATVLQTNLLIICVISYSAVTGHGQQSLHGVEGGLVSEDALWYSSLRSSDAFGLSAQVIFSFSMLYFRKGCSKSLGFLRQKWGRGKYTEISQNRVCLKLCFTSDIGFWLPAPVCVGASFSDPDFFFGMVSLLTAPEALDQTSLEVLGFLLLTPVLTSSKLHYRDAPSLFRGKWLIIQWNYLLFPCFLFLFSFHTFILRLFK